MASKGSRKSSLIDVAKRANVSVATVSRALNDYPYISPATLFAVRAAVEKTGYVRPGDRHHRGGPSPSRTGNVAVLLFYAGSHSPRAVSIGHVLEGINDALRERSFAMVVSSHPTESEMAAYSNQSKVDGVIVCAVELNGDIPKQLRAVPTVFISETSQMPTADVDVVAEDAALTGALAAQHFVDQGHRQLCVLNLEPASPLQNVRRMFFSETAERYGASILALTGTPADIPSYLDRLASKATRPTGIFVLGSDQYLLVVCHGLESRGISVGKDVYVAVCGEGNVAVLDKAIRNLTTVTIDTEAVGRSAVEALLGRMSHPLRPRRRILIAPSIAER